MRKNLFIAGGYAAFFLVSFVVSFYFTFDPTHIVGGLLTSLSQDQGYELDLPSQIDKYRLSGIEAENVSIRPANFKNPIKFDFLQARLSLLPLILGRRSIGFKVRLYDGQVTGKVMDSKKNFSAQVDIKNLDLSRMPPPKENSLWPAAKLNAKGDLSMSPKDDPKKWRGSLKAAFGEGKLSAFSYMGFNVPEIKMQGADLDVRIAGGRAEIKTLELKSPDLPFNGTGDITMQAPLSQSQVKIEAKINPSNAFMEQVPALKALPPDKTVRYNGGLGPILGTGM